MKTYNFVYYGYIPSYRDFDQSDIDIEANNDAEAWKKFHEKVKNVQEVSIESIDDVPSGKDAIKKKMAALKK